MAQTDDEREAAIAHASSRNAAVARWKAFLESTPPNTSVSVSNLLARREPLAASGSWAIRTVELELYCEDDGGVRTFVTATSQLLVGQGPAALVRYTCRNCGGGEKLFALMMEQDDDRPMDVRLMKLGEFPPFGAPISKRISKLLDAEDLELYRKGVRAEAQGLGVGAASYFRRIVENQWQRLVTEIREAAVQLGITDLAVFDEASRENSFSKAVAMLNDAIPAKLLILDGRNPLTLLHKPLSVQLHGLSDAECLQQAADIRLVLTALLENIADVLKQQDELRAAVGRLGQVRT
jgi:hypothetical protein